MFATLSAAIKTWGLDRHYWLAFSGGLDSRVLLHLCATLQKTLPFRLTAVHVNHGLQVQANNWQHHCQDIASDSQIPFKSFALTLNRQKNDSLEHIARKARYDVFANLLQKEDVLLTAHHQDDQAETFLLQLLRGAGLAGLSAMPHFKPFAAGYHARPLLNFTRDALQQYADQHGLHWINDPSNENTDFSRNFIRHEIMPLLKQHWPAASATIARSAKHCAEAAVVIADDLQDLLFAAQGSKPKTLSVQALQNVTSTKRKLLMRAWLQQQMQRMPSEKKLADVLMQVTTAAWDKMPAIDCGDYILRRYRDDLYCLTACAANINLDCEWLLSVEDCAPSNLQAKQMVGAGFKLPRPRVRMCVGQKIIKVRLGANRPQQQLKKLFQAWGVPPWERHNLPLIFYGDDLLCVPGYFENTHYKVQPGETGWTFIQI